MKNTIKKIASIAMAFTLLGTGTVVTKTISPKSNNILIANAACQYHDGSVRYGRVIVNYRVDGHFKKCKCCGQITGTTRNSKAYRVKNRFNYSIAASLSDFKTPQNWTGNYAKDASIGAGGSLAYNIVVYEGTVLEISNDPKTHRVCLSGTRKDLIGQCFEHYMHNLERLY